MAYIKFVALKRDIKFEAMDIVVINAAPSNSGFTNDFSNDFMQYFVINRNIRLSELKRDIVFKE